MDDKQSEIDKFVFFLRWVMWPLGHLFFFKLIDIKLYWNISIFPFFKENLIKMICQPLSKTHGRFCILAHHMVSNNECQLDQIKLEA